ncbi:MAG: diadenylate cyclase CdaA [Bdellovibrionota bacterium]
MLVDPIRTIFSWKSIIDIGLVAVLFYQIISMLRGTRAAQVLIGMLVIFVAYVFSNLLQFETLHWIISKFYSSFIMVVIVLFQDDIRRLLSRFGKGPFFTGIEVRSGALIIEEAVNAAKSLSHERIGALIVFERSIGLDKLYDHSVQLNALVSEQLLISIFQSFSPLHDGAVIVQKNRISCASAQLPLSKNPLFSKKMGTRHSAAVGISEETDAVVMVVSEETGNISIAWEGNLQKQTSTDATKKMLHVLLLPRGERNVFLSWFEDKFLFDLNKFLIQVKHKFPFRQTKNVEYERRKSDERRSSRLNFEELKNSIQKQVEHENNLASNSSKNIFVRFTNNSKIKSVLSSSEDFVSSVDKSGKVLSIKSDKPHPENTLYEQKNIEEDHMKEEDSPQGITQNEALRAIVDLAPEDRFDPPIPKPPPPRDVSIGGVSLNPPIEEPTANKEENKEEKVEKT